MTAPSFHDRRTELRTVLDAFDALRRGAPRWLAIVGPRKIGKTSLLLEAARQAPRSVDVAVVDVFERVPLDLEIFRLIAVRAVDALLAEEAGTSLARRLHVPSDFRAALRRVRSLRAAPELLGKIEDLADARASTEAVFRWLQLPEDLCITLDRKLVLTLDEVQELGSLKRTRFEPFPAMRAVWQHHTRVAYVISGSEPTMLRELVSSRHSAFFQHFTLCELGPFQPDDAVELLVDSAPEDRPTPQPLAERVVDVLGTHPFYLQMAGEAIVADAPPYDAEVLKSVLQSLVFSRTGRLSLVFQNEYSRLVGNATTAAATLAAVAAQGPTRLTDVARAIGASTASTARYLERLGDAIVRDDEGLYSIADPLFATWIQWRSPGGTTVPMRVLGDEAELAVAEHLAALGFDLVYQSRASRGAFDLLALRGPDQLGLQVKRSSLPLRFGMREWKRMEGDAARLGWRWAIAAVNAESEVRVLDPNKARAGREIRLDDDATIDNLLRWIDAPPASKRPR